MKPIRTINEAVTIIKKNPFISALFAISTLFFPYQHTKGLPWDFTAYLLNAKHLFGNSPYFEWYRPPLAPVIMGIFSFAGWNAAEYLYIAFVSGLFLYATIKFSAAFETDPRTLYALLLSPFLILRGTYAGTELLSLSLTMMFFASVINKKPSGAAYLSLAALTRYPNIALLPFILIYKHPKKILAASVIFLLSFAPWLAYNYLKTGSMLTSISDSYALNVNYHDYLRVPFEADNILIVLAYLLPLSLAGIFIKMKKPGIQDLLLLAAAFFTLQFMQNIPIKDMRYLFDLVLPAAYFSYFAVKRFSVSRYIIVILSISIVIGASALYPRQAFPESPDIYRESLSHIDNCATLSNGWVYLNYYGKPADGTMWEKILAKKIDDGYRIVLFKNITEPEYAKNEAFIKSFPVLEETDNYTILGRKDACAKNQRLDRTYIDKLNEMLLATGNYTVESAPCKIIAPDILQPVCKIVR